MAKHYIVYYREKQEAQKTPPDLNQCFGKNNVYQLNGSTSFVVKTDDDTLGSAVMDTLGFTNEEQATGVVVNFENADINGWYYQTLWDFIKRPYQKPEAKESPPQRGFLFKTTGERV